MTLRKISSLALLLLLASSVNAINVSVEDSCATDEEPMISLNSTTGGHISEPGIYSNQVCLSEVQYTEIRENCQPDEQPIASMASESNSHLSVNYNEYNYKVCAPRAESAVRNNCRSNETKILSVASNNNSHAAAPGYTDQAFSQGLCLRKSMPDNVTVSLSGLSDSVYSDGEQINTDSSITPPINYPYIVDNSPKGLISYGSALQISRPAENKVSITQKTGSGEFILPLTTGGYTEIEDERDQVVERELLNTISPSFRFPSPEEPLVKVIYKSPYQVEGFEDQLGTGSNRFSIRNLGLQKGELAINIDSN